jgi:hypothetical protein
MTHRAFHASHRNGDEDGITIVELVVVMLMTTLFTTIIMTYTIGYWRYGYLQEADLSTLTTRLNAGDFLRAAIGPSSGLISQNSIPDANTSNADTSISSGQFWVPIHAVPGNIPVGAKNTTTPLLYYQRPSLSSSGGYIMNGTQPYEDEFVLYLNGTTRSLMQRSLANPSASNNKLKTSCPPESANNNCPADKIIAKEINSIDMRYFSRTGNTIDYHSSQDSLTGNYTGPDFTAAEVVEFNLNLVKKPLLQTTTATSNSTIIRVALRND